MNEPVETIWISTLSGSIGIVLTKGPKGNKAFIKQVDGNDEAKDVQSIIDYGTRIREDQADMILKHLKQ